MADAAAIKYSLGELLEEEIGMRADDFEPVHAYGVLSFDADLGAFII